jgi:nucleosome binding factor SPN SPT16 subunit
MNVLMIMNTGFTDIRKEGSGNSYALTLLKTVCFALFNLNFFINYKFINKESLKCTSSHGITDQKTNFEC